MVNHAMFQRNGRAGYVLKPFALRGTTNPNEIQSTKDLLAKRTRHYFDVTIMSAQQLPRPRDSSGREVSLAVHPFVEVSVYVPDWATFTSNTNATTRALSPKSEPVLNTVTPAKVISQRTGVVKNNGFNPLWEEKLRIPFDCVGDMRDLVFVRFIVRQAGRKDDEEPLAVYCASLGSLALGKQLTMLVLTSPVLRTLCHQVIDIFHCMTCSYLNIYSRPCL
jgi:phosphatidylinositol phospholipase C delta